MIMLPLEPIDDRANPVFKDAASCAKWLSQLQLTNLNLAQGTLRVQIDEFNRFPLRGKERLHTLEALRETVNTMQADYAKKLFGKKLPLSDDEFTSLISLSNLWLSMFNGYLRCLQSLEAGDSSLAADAALLAQRCLLYCGLQLGEFLRMGCEPDGKSWQRFHTIYSHIEQQSLQQIPVADKFSRSGRDVSCRTLYTKILLLHRARLLGMTRNQWHIVDRWLELWGDTFSIEPQCSMSREDAPPLAVDLAGIRGMIPVQRATSAPSMRFMAMVPLSKIIRVKTILLQQGQLPLHLDLGNEINSDDCVKLLNRLHACWCEPHVESLADEPRDAPVVQLCAGLESTYAHIARKPFKTPTIAGIADKEAQRQIETFGRVLDQTDRHNLFELGFLSEDWLAEEDGLLQGRLLRKLKTGVRLGLNQIICVHKPDTTAFKLGVVTLATVTRSGQLYIGVRYLPGNPQAVIVRCKESANLLSGAAAALLLPEMANLRIPASIIIPRDWFQTGRPMEISFANSKDQNVTLGMSVDKGNDFERVSYKAAG
jgi:cyclic-di-GMP-binding protein